ncbi:MBL fold metallo-hydrolase, partial [Streptomyces scabiei]
SHRTFAYTGDTGPAPALAVLAQGVDLLVSEIVDLPRIQDDLRTRVAHLPGVAERVGFNMAHNHLSAEEIARIAREAQVAEVVLT